MRREGAKYNVLPMINSRSGVVGILSVFLIGLFSCQSGKKVSYFLDLPDTITGIQTIPRDSFISPEIRPGDRLSVQVFTVDPNTAQIFNPPGASLDGDAGSRAYVVDDQGQVNLPLIGAVNVKGMDRERAAEAIAEQARHQLVNPVVRVQFAQFPITVLGEVGNPGLFQSPTDKISVLQALGMAGDLRPEARRDNILLLREAEGSQQIVYRYNLNSAALFHSDYFYLQPGDVLYVSPNRAKARTAVTDVTRDRYFSYLISGATLLLSAVSLIMINNR